LAPAPAGWRSGRTSMSQLPPPPPSPLGRKIIYLRLDAFYASVEQRDCPELAGRPVLVTGSPQEPGLVADASWEARQCGIQPAMATRTALRRCPQAVLRPGDFGKYRQVSEQFYSLLRDYADLVEPVAPDAAYLDVTFNRLEIPFGSRVARMIKARIRRELRLTACAGVAPNKFLARLAADRHLPDGLVVVRSRQVAEFLDNLPVVAMPGVGRVTGRRLEELGVCTLGQLAAYAPAEILRHLGGRGIRLWELAHGRDDDPVVPEHQPEQLVQEVAFPVELYKTEELDGALRQLAAELSARARRRGLQGRVVTLTIRYPGRGTDLQSLSLPGFTDRSAVLLREARQLLARTRADQLGARRLSLTLSGFSETLSEQLSLFAPAVPAGGRNGEEPRNGTAGPRASDRRSRQR
jgi:DNA polymerase IV